MIPPEERTYAIDPICDIFPKQVGCFYSRYGMGGRYDTRSAMCILGLNMINDKVFFLHWCWLYCLVLLGLIRVVTRFFQLTNASIRYFLMNLKMNRYLRKNAHLRHIKHYITNCSLGDWFVLYQMSKNLNTRFFAEFMSVLAMSVDPDPNIEPEDPVIEFTPEEIQKHKEYEPGSNSSSSKDSSDSSSGSEDEEEDKKENFFSKLEGAEDGMDGGDGGGGGLTGKERALIKMGKKAKSANKSAMMAAAAMKRARRK